MAAIFFRPIHRYTRRLCEPGIAHRYYANFKDQEKVFDKILISNRGEIACRIIRTCKEMGIKTVSIYSDADAQALHVQMSDEAICVGPAATSQSYLNIDAVLKATLCTGSQAVHPGYGFLSENSDFAKQLSKLNVAFIGPNVYAIEVMGDKLESKRTAINAGVNTIPGYDGILESPTEAVQFAKEIGYPVMLKASAGGGGKGMRVAWNDKEVIEGFKLATEEAITSVNDERLLIEKFIHNPRHIEIQVLGDKHGNVVYLNERECSIQRRNQKVIEEAPSTFLDASTRCAMGKQAVALAKSVQYNSAGTVEFLVDSQRNFYFLEMNTRLQVEHPITECITGIDIVKEMIKSAAGLKLSYTQDDIGISGWAIESRIYAEDPVRFLPSIGYLSKYIEPCGKPGLENVRVDTGIVEGSTISMFYDPMISKLVTYGPDRNSAIATMAKALDSYCIKGVTHNIPILRDIITHPKFLSGDISTNFIKEVYPNGFQGRHLNKEETEQLIASACVMYLKKLKTSTALLNQPRQITTSMVVHELALTISNNTYVVTVNESDTNYYQLHMNNKDLHVFTDWQLGHTIMYANIGGKDVTVHFEDRNGQTLFLRIYGDKHSVLVQDSRFSELSSFVHHKSTEVLAHILRAPMPGVVKSVICQKDDEVEEGTTIVTLEAMKMQNPLFAPITGKVKAVHVKEGDNVAEDDVILEFYKS